MIKLFKKRLEVIEVVTELENAMKDADARQQAMLFLIMDWLKNDYPRARGLTLAWSEGHNIFEQYYKCAGMQPAEAILMFDQLHHRVQHEGVPGYD